MAKKLPGRADQLRAVIAQEAARLMAEHGIHDYLTAKRKAAERYGVAHADNAVLPRNTEIEQALHAHHRLFGSDEHARSLREQRKAAIRAMGLLAQFRPRLVGPVLNGVATEHADIQLHVFADSAEAVYFLLMDRHVAYEVTEKRVKMQADRQVCVPGLRFRDGGHDVEVLVFPHDGIRQAPISPVDGRPMRRADESEVRRLVGESPAGALA